MTRKKQPALGLLIAASSLACACIGGWVSEDSGTDVDLHAVWGTASGSRVFAVGEQGTVLMRRGGSWKRLNSGVEDTLYGVWGTSEEHVVVVGDNCAALQFDGEPEKPQDGGEAPPDLRILPAEPCSTFYAIDGYAPAGANVVGERAVYGYDGVSLATAGTFKTRSLGVDRSDQQHLYISGEAGVFRHFHDNSWDNREIALCPVDRASGECPVDPMLPILWSVWVGDEGKGATVGTFGGFWRIPLGDGAMPSPVDVGFSTELRGVHGWVNAEASENKTTIYAVGQYGVAVKVQGEKITREAPGTNHDLNDVWVSEGGKDVYAVGQSGTIVHFTP